MHIHAGGFWHDRGNPTLTFGIGETSKPITVDILDPTYMDYKYFSVQLSNGSTNALIGNESATGSWYYYYDYGSYNYGGGYSDYYGWY